MENIEYSLRNIESKLDEIVLLLRDMGGKFESSGVVEHLEESNALLGEMNDKLGAMGQDNEPSLM